jgi:pyruvate/2-oxoglutarate dehydrogenase complex dihydrolipoamide acyltransferase (E2) component
MSKVEFPTMADSEVTGVLVKWFVEDGDEVGNGQLIAEIQMDKVDMEVHAHASGTIYLHVEAGSEVLQGATIARIDIEETLSREAPR